MATLKLFSSILAASVLATSMPAMADTRTKEVHHEDLDLASAKGQQRLKTRVKQAVRQVCASPRAMTVRERLDLNRCEAEAMAAAMPKAEQTIAAYLDSRRLAARDGEAIVGN